MQIQVQQRRDRLLKYLRESTFASVEDLSRRLQVSALTARRDLDALQAEGLVERVHGGARVAAPGRAMDASELAFYARREALVAEKRAIARAAARLVQPDSVLFLDASTSALYFTRALPAGLPLTIVTYSAYLPVELAEKPDLEVISTGGMLHRKSLCYLGEDTRRALAPYHAHQAIFGAKGVTPEAGCTDALLPEIRLKAALLEQVGELILLADHTKLGNVGLAAFADLSRVHTLVTDERARPDLVQALRAQGTRVIVAPITDEED